MRRTSVAAPMLAAVLSASVLTGCGGNGGTDEDGATTTSIAAPVSPVETVGEIPDFRPEPGAAIVVFGGDEAVELTIVECVIDAGAEPAGEVPAAMLGLSASGTSLAGVEINLDIRRFRSQGASTTITDTITVVEGDPDQPDRALVAQRFEVDGLVSDLRDPDADDPLVRIAGSTVEAAGVFAPPGDTRGLVEGRLRATCS